MKPKGQALVEFALVLPLFMLALFAIIDISRYVYTANALSEGVREAARQASVPRFPAECNGMGLSQRGACVTAIANARIKAVERPLTMTTVCTKRAPDGSGGVANTVVVMSACYSDGEHTLRVTGTAPFTLVTPFVSGFVGSTLSATAEVTVQ